MAFSSYFECFFNANHTKVKENYNSFFSVDRTEIANNKGNKKNIELTIILLALSFARKRLVDNKQ